MKRHKRVSSEVCVSLFGEADPLHVSLITMNWLQYHDAYTKMRNERRAMISVFRICYAIMDNKTYTRRQKKDVLQQPVYHMLPASHMSFTPACDPQMQTRETISICPASCGYSRSPSSLPLCRNCREVPFPYSPSHRLRYQPQDLAVVCCPCVGYSSIVHKHGEYNGYRGSHEET